MTLYKPPTKVVTTQVTYLSMVNRADPDWARLKRMEVEYEMSNGRIFTGDPNHRGAYD